MSLGLVTGGSRGIGRAVVDALLADGWTVAFTFRQDASAARDVEAAAAGLARGFALDLADREGPGRLVAEIEASMGPVDALVNNAAVRSQALLAMTSDAEWDGVMDANLDGAFRCCRAVLPKMMHRRQGAIVNVSSLAAVAGVAGQAAYAASKAALLGMTRALAREVGRRGIRVNAVLPGFVATPMTAGLSDDVVRGLRSHECLARGTSAADVAHLVAFLVSERAAAITGQALNIDAGTSA
jgi:3-oxoacyl-[acyl-carrier protein] reductase